MEIKEVELWYPKSSDDQCAQISLMHVRAARDIRIVFSFERDGWVVLAQDENDYDDYGNPPPWVEKAFIQSWDK